MKGHDNYHQPKWSTEATQIYTLGTGKFGIFECDTENPAKGTKASRCSNWKIYKGKQ